MESVTPLKAAVEAVKRTRPIHEFDVPVRMAGDSGIKTVALVELTAEEEKMAAKRARGDQMLFASELTKQAIAEVNSSRVSLGDGSTDQWWARMPSALRNQLVQAFAEIHVASEADTEAFTKSRRVKV